jgi:hypothetical protein
MSSTVPCHPLPPPEVIRQQIAAVEDELKALRRLLRASKAAVQADEARLRRLSAQQQGVVDAV